MDLRQRLTAFAILATTWLSWVLAGLAVGGVVVALARAIELSVPAKAARHHDVNYACRLDVQ